MLGAANARFRQAGGAGGRRRGQADRDRAAAAAAAVAQPVRPHAPLLMDQPVIPPGFLDALVRNPGPMHQLPPIMQLMAQHANAPNVLDNNHDHLQRRRIGE